MDNNNWRPTQAGDPTMDSGDWRSQLPRSSRERIVNKIMETLKRHLPVTDQDGLLELKKIAVRFEEKVYADATNQSEYLRQISLKMLKMESKSQNSTGSSLAANSFGASSKPPESTSHGIQSQILSQGQPLSIPLSANQSQQRQQLLSQNIQNGIASQSSASLSPALPSVSGLTQNSIPNAVGQGTSMQNISGASQISLGNSAGQGVPSNVFANSQRQLQGRQQGPQTQQPQQQAQNQQQYIYQQQLQQQILNQKFQQGNMPPSMVSSHIQHQQQQQQSHQNLLQPSQLQSSQQAGMQTSSVMQSSVMQQPPVQQPNQAMLQQTGQSVLRQQQQAQQSAVLHQQQTSMQPQSILAPQQQQPLTGQQSSAGNMQQNQLIGQQTGVGDIQHQQQQRLLGQQNNIPNLQQQQQQQQLIAQQNNLSSMHQQQLGPQSNVSGLQQQLLSGNSGMQTNQPNVHMLQQNKVPVQQQAQQNTSNILQPHGQQPQVQQPQQQLLSQIPSQSAQLQQSLGLQQPNQLSRELQQRFQASGQVSGSLLQPQNVMDQQKQLYQPHRALPDTSSTSLDSTAQTGHANGGDWQEEVYQKIKGLKEMYFHELSEMNQKIAIKLQQHEFSQQPKSEQLERLKMFRTMLERLLAFLQCPKSSIGPGIKEKLSQYEKQIVNILTTNRPRKPAPSLQQGQLSSVHMHPMQQPQSQIMQVQSHENQMSSQMHSTNIQSNVASLQQNGISNLQHNSVSSLSGVPNTQQNIMGSLHPASALDAGQGNALTSIQQVGSMQQNPVNTPQTANINSLSSQTGVTMMQSNINSFQSNSNMVQHQHLKQQQEQQMLQTHQLKQQMQQRQMLKQQMLQQQQQQHQQQQQQQLHQQGKQQLSSQLQTQQMTQPHQINDVNELKMRQGMSVKPGGFQQNLSSNQRSSFSHQQLKSGPSFPISSPQLLQAASPQIMQHSSPQVDQQNLLVSLTKAGTPLQSASSPFVVTSPSTPVAPSPIPGDSDKPMTGLSSLSNSGNIVHQQMSGIVAPAPSLAIGTPGMSASPLLAEFSGPDGMNGNTLATVSGKPSATELPLERLIRVIKSMSPSALSASVGDISSVISMSDRIAGSTPGNGSRAAVGEDLVAMTKCRLQARNFAPLDNMSGTRKIKRYTSAMPLNVVSSTGIINDNFKQLTASEMSNLESTATSNVKRHRFETNHAVLEEIKEINQRLIDTVVDVNEEDVDSSVAAAAAEGGEGTLVKCSFTAVALGQNLKSQYASAQMSPIQPLRLLVPSNYPNCSPVLLDKCLEDVNSKGYEDLSAKVKSRFSISLRTLSQPMSLGEIARTWDVCVRAVISDYAQQSGGGSFSTKYGSWENCLPAI